MKGMIKTLRSFKKISEDPLYSLDYKADYGLDRLLAMGAGSDEEFAGNVGKILLGGLPVKVRPEGACSTFVASTPQEDKLFARNFDYKSGMTMLVRTYPVKGYRSIALSNLGHIGFGKDDLPEKNLINRFKTLACVYSPLDGMNEKGFAIAVNTAAEQVTHQDSGKPKVMTTLAIRVLLDRASDVEEGIRILKGLDMNSSGKIGYHFHMADRKGDSAIIEYIDNEIVVIRKEKKAPCFCLTNFTVSTVEKNGVGQERYEIMEDCLKRTDSILSEEEAMDLLNKAQMDGKNYYEPGHMYYESRTQWSAVYNLTHLKATIVPSSAFGKSYCFGFDR